MQKKLILTLAIAAVAVITVFVAAALVPSILVSSSGPSIKSVAVTWGLLGEIVYRLGGGEIEVYQLLPPGAEIHDWEPTPEAVELVGKSRLLIYTGLGLDDWAVKLGEVTNVKVFKAAYDLPILITYEKEGHEIDHTHDEEHEHAHGMVDPHIWLSPRNTAKLVENIAGELVQVFPEYKEKINDNMRMLIAELRELDREIEFGLKPYAGRVFITQHDAFQYLARSYGLRAEGILGPEEEEPTSSKLAEIYDLISREGIKVVYAEDGLIKPVLESIKRDTGVEILMLNTGEALTLEDVKQGRGYTWIMRENFRTLVEGFRLG